MTIAEEIHQRLQAAFAPETLQVQDDSEKHRGHGGWSEGGESHFSVLIRAPTLAAMPRLARHRAVNAALGADLIGRIHALALDAG
ncbi:BolA family protein [Rhodobacter ferrooxidans]|uniref:BolA family protein n=1 Tax=Rhodobacter ferrooxidans TaxID=371731 RepID=C8S2N6_9RHOB|nr:BolA family protein [Rhodobacter sp. SW2]EEW24712.1 BolA family protein [Rhodobacter sp. SW2]